MNASLAELVRIEDVDFYDDHQYEIYDRMRAEAPAYYYEPLDVFLLTRMDDVRYVSTHPELFSNTGGLTLNQLRMARSGSSAAFERFNEPEGELVITLDPPRQRALRGLMSPTLTPRYLERFRARIEAFCADLVADVRAGETFDFVNDIAAKLPLYAAAAILGVRDVDIARMEEWVEALELLTRVESVDDLDGPGRRFDDLKQFLRDQVALKRREPGEDMISLFLRSSLDGGPVPDPIVIAHVATLMSNGGTTRLLLASLAEQLARNPEQTVAIKNDPQLIDGAIEECLRLMPPARGFVRTATADSRLDQVTVWAGQRVYLLYPAANRDPAHFDVPHVYDATRRDSVGHAAFGFGTHFCLGAALARMEARALFRELLGRYGEIRLEGEPVRYRHVQLNGWATLPVSLHR